MPQKEQRRSPGGYVSPQPIAKRWTLVVPKIKREFFKGGVRYYETDDKKIWQADIFDSKLVPKIKSK